MIFIKKNRLLILTQFFNPSYKSMRMRMIGPRIFRRKTLRRGTVHHMKKKTELNLT